MNYLKKNTYRFLFNCFYFVVLSFLLFLFPQLACAQTYGSGSYGGGNYNVGDVSSNSTANNTTSGNGSASTPVCGMTPPSSTPQWLYAAIPQDGNAIMLYFTDADTSAPYDHYTVTYGLSRGNYSFGLDNAGGKGIRTVLINALLPNTTYYFKIRPGNGCAPGVWSNEISATTKSLISQNTLQFTSTTILPEKEAPQSQTAQNTQSQPACQQTYTVKSGDTFYAIAKKLLQDGGKYPDISNLNKDTYPSLQTSNSIYTGWKLKIPCSTQQEAATPKLPTPETGYDVNVTVKDTNNKPVEGAAVTLHSIPKQAKTDKNGIATFHQIEQGEHTVIIAYANYQGEENIHLSGKVKTFDVNIQVKPVNVLVNPLVLVIIGVLVVIIGVLCFFLWRKSKNSPRDKYLR